MAPLKQWMRQEDIYDNDLYEILSSYNIRDAPKDFKKINQPKWDEIWRKGKVERFKELKDQQSRNRLDKKMKKLEKIWRNESGIKMTSIKTNERVYHKNTKTKKKKQNTSANHRKQPKTKKKDKLDPSKSAKTAKKSKSKGSSHNNTQTKKKKNHAKHGKKKKSSKNGHELKQWMQKNGCYEDTLYKELMRKGVYSPKSIKNITEKQFDTIVRKVRVDRFAQLKDQTARNRYDILWEICIIISIYHMFILHTDATNYWCSLRRNGGRLQVKYM